MEELTYRHLLWAYANGIFPMAQTADDPEIGWYDPDPRGVLPLDAVHIPRSLAKRLRKAPKPESITIHSVGERVVGLADVR